ncbi:MAG: YlbE-like family protein [Coprobacillus cateniformis]|nr:YlbE-like family protein [Coprobacillus cateniformis]
MYLRLHPKWYLILSRYPQEFPTMIEQYKVENKLTFADRIEKVGTMLQMIEMLL